MKKKLLPAFGHALCLSVLLMLCCVTIIVTKAFMPEFILPRITITTLIALSLFSVVLEYWIFRGEITDWSYLEAVLAAAAAFGVMTWAVGFGTLSGACKAGLFGGVTYGLCLLAFRAMEAHLESAAVKHKGLALTLAAALLLLASQSLAGIPVLG